MNSLNIQADVTAARHYLQAGSKLLAAAIAARLDRDAQEYGGLFLSTCGRVDTWDNWQATEGTHLEPRGLAPVYFNTTTNAWSIA